MVRVRTYCADHLYSQHGAPVSFELSRHVKGIHTSFSREVPWHAPLLQPLLPPHEALLSHASPGCWSPCRRPIGRVPISIELNETRNSTTYLFSLPENFIGDTGLTGIKVTLSANRNAAYEITIGTELREGSRCSPSGTGCTPRGRSVVYAFLPARAPW